MNTQNIKNAFMRVLYNSIVTFGKGVVWTIRLVTGQTAREARIAREELQAQRIAEWEASVSRLRDQCQAREAEKAAQQAAQQAEATRIREQAIVDFKQACIEASAKGDVIVEVPELLKGTQFVAVPANDTKTVLTVVDGGAE